MNTLAVGNRKKLRKKKRKSKAKLTTEYKEIEQEVKILLEAVERNLNLSLSTQDIESDTQSADFFCIKTTSPTTPDESIGEEEHEDDYNNKQREQEDNYDEKPKYKATSIKTTSDDGSLQSENRTVASTYIQIDALDTPLTKAIIKQKHITDTSSLLYMPATQLHTRIVLPAEVSTLNNSMLRMLNRYYEERHNLPVELVKSLVNKPIFSNDNYFYRTFCAKQFQPIFCNARAELVQIPMRHILQLKLKKLCFTEHPELLQEHRLANALEEIYEEYVRHVQDKEIENSLAKLRAERAVMREMLQQALELAEEEQRQEQQVARQLVLVQELRQQLYAAAQQRKQLTQQILERWLMLKKLRKSQLQQYTRFMLRINVTAVTEEAANWKQRYENDLQEIYGEQLELYYRQQRLRKSSKKIKKGVLSEKPVKPQFKEIAKEVRNNYKYLFGGPHIQVQRCDLKKIDLMPSTSKTHIFFMRIFLDRQFVGNTKNYRLEPDFTLNINETFGIVLERRLPKEIYITVHEKSKFPKKKKLAKIQIPLNGIQHDILHSRHNFSAKHEFITGYMNVGLLYEPQTDALSNWKEENVRQTAATTDAELSDEEVEEGENFVVNSNTCSFEEERLMFCNMKELMENRRLQLLHSRQMQNDMRTKDLRFIPALESEVVVDWFNGPSPMQDNVVDMGNWMEPIDLQRHQGKKYLKCLYEAIKDQCARLSKVMEHGDNLLLGDEPGNWMGLFDAMMNIFRPSRFSAVYLNFRDRNLSSQVISWEINKTFKLIFTVVRATGIPVRNSELLLNDAQQRRESRHIDNDKYFYAQNFKYANVSPFIAVIFKDKMSRTLASEGSNPTWNEQLVLQLSVNSNDLREDIKIALFDEVIESQFTDDANIRNVDVYQRIQTNWLAEYRLPVSTLFQQHHLEGVLELKTPPVLIGYKRASLSAEMEDNVIIDTEYPKYKEAVYLWYYISVEPVAQLPTVNTSCLECAELREVRQQLAVWTLQVRELQPTRYINPLICTADGKRVCLTRLIEAVPLPMSFDADDEHSLERVCRFVAHLNVFKCYDDCLRFQGLWLNNKILLDTTWGSAKDLGLLLCNLLLAIGRKVWLVLGLAVPYGDSAFVAFVGTAGLELCDPCSGKRYNIKDVFCPLMKIYCVVSQDNIYCNMQSEMRVFMTNFNFNDTSCWLPAFSKSNPAPLGGVQNLNYLYRDTCDTNEIRFNIERKIIKKISFWRPMRKTLWNRAFQSRLHNILQELERDTASGSNIREDFKYTQQLATEFPGYKFYGFTLNFPYTNLTAISDYIKATAFHLNSDKNVEFSVAVHLEVFRNNIIEIKQQIDARSKY